VSLAGPRRHAPGVLGGISDIAVNAALAIIEGAEPRNEVEAALAIQMACTHTAAMAVLTRIGVVMGLTARSPYGGGGI
jgi:hypothetical protein